jgi:hypothetical protein
MNVIVTDEMGFSLMNFLPPLMIIVGALGYLALCHFWSKLGGDK